MLGHPVFRAKIREWLKVLRKANCAVVLATQSLSDAARSGILDVLIESCPTKIFLPNEEAATGGTPEHPGPRDLYEAMGLNETQIEIIRSATQEAALLPGVAGRAPAFRPRPRPGRAVVRRHQLEGTDRPSGWPRAARRRAVAVCVARRTGSGL